jgi:AcrR family transcriptional regulator
VPGLRERKKQETRRAIARAALRLACKRGGPCSVTVEDISETANVSPRTFFNYFSTKEDAILDIDERRFARLGSLVLGRPADEAPLQALRQGLVAISDDYLEPVEEWSLRMQLIRDYPSLYPSYIASFALAEREMVTAIAARTGLDPSKHLYPSLVVGCALAALRLAASRWQAVGSCASLTDLIDEAFSRLAAGLTPPAG